MIKTPGERIKQLRTENNMSIAQLAEAVGFSADYIRDLENDKVEAKLDAMVKLALVFGVSVNKLMTGINDVL